MEKQIAEITTPEPSRSSSSSSRSPSSSRSSSSSESSSSQNVERVRDISPPPTPVRVVRRRQRVQREKRRVNEDESLATEDDQGLLQFMATSSVPSVSPYMHASPQDKGQPTKVDSPTSNKSTSRATTTFNTSTLSDVPESHNRKGKDDDSRDSNSSNSQSIAASGSESGEGLNRDRSINQGTPCIDNRGIRPTRGTRQKHSTEARAASHDRRAVRRTKSGHSSFSRGDFSTPSDEHREYRRDEIFSGAYSGGTTSRGPKKAEKRTISRNGGDMESLNTMASRYVEVSSKIKKIR